MKFVFLSSDNFTFMSIADRLSKIRSTLPEGVELVAVSKFHPAERLMEAYDAGQRTFGESRPQEMTAKQAVLPADIRWHMIGHLQTNKVRMIAPFVTMIDSVDSARLVDEIDRQAVRCSRRIDILLEVHVADEDTKSGWDPDELRAYVAGGELASISSVCAACSTSCGSRSARSSIRCLSACRTTTLSRWSTDRRQCASARLYSAPGSIDRACMKKELCTIVVQSSFVSVADATLL